MTVETVKKGSGLNGAVVECMTTMNQLRQEYADWFAEYEDAGVDLEADRQQMEALLQSAPTPFLKGMMYGKLAMRMQISNLTERAF